MRIEEKCLYRVTTPGRKSCYVVGRSQFEAAFIGNIKLGELWKKEQLTVEFIDIVVTNLLIKDDEKHEG